VKVTESERVLRATARGIRPKSWLNWRYDGLRHLAGLGTEPDRVRMALRSSAACRPLAYGTSSIDRVSTDLPPRAT